MVDIWLIFNLFYPFQEVNYEIFVQAKTALVQVLVQTYIQHLRTKIEDKTTINHHGKELELDGGTVVGISKVGGKTQEETPVVAFDK